MSYDLIEEGLNKIKDVTTWNSLLIHYNHKAHPNEYTCYNMNFETSELLSKTILNMCDAYHEIVTKNCDKKVVEYTGTNPKNVVDKISTRNLLIKDCWNSLIEHINNSDDTTSFKNIKSSAYIFVGTYANSDGKSQNLYLLTRKKSIVNL